MKSIISFIFLGFCLPAFANTFTPFLDIEDAKQLCPAPHELTFKPNNVEIPNSAGKVEGFNGRFFVSLNKFMRAPAKSTANGFIVDANFRESNGMYGYDSNGTVTCLYSYMSKSKQKVYLSLRSSDL